MLKGVIFVCINILVCKLFGIDMFYFAYMFCLNEPVLVFNKLSSYLNSLELLYHKDKNKFYFNLLSTMLLFFVLRLGIIEICFLLGGEQLAQLASISVFKLIVKEFGLADCFLELKTMVRVFFGECKLSVIHFFTFNFLTLTHIFEFIDFTSLKEGFIRIFKSHPVISKIVRIIEINSTKPSVERSSPFRPAFFDFTIQKVIPFIKARLSAFVPLNLPKFITVSLPFSARGSNILASCLAYQKTSSRILFANISSEYFMAYFNRYMQNSYNVGGFFSTMGNLGGG
jgi:hypothetical protein